MPVNIILAAKMEYMNKDVKHRGGRHLQEEEKKQIYKMKRSGYKNKEIAAAFQGSIRSIQGVKVLPVETGQVQKEAKRSRTNETKRAVARTLSKEGVPRVRWHEEPTCQKLLWRILRKVLRKRAVIKIEEVVIPNSA